MSEYSRMPATVIAERVGWEGSPLTPALAVRRFRGLLPHDDRQVLTAFNDLHTDVTANATAADGTVLFDMASVTVTRYQWRGNTIPNRWTTLRTA